MASAMLRTGTDVITKQILLSPPGNNPFRYFHCTERNTHVAWVRFAHCFDARRAIKCSGFTLLIIIAVVRSFSFLP